MADDAITHGEGNGVHTRVLDDRQAADLEAALDDLAEVTDRVRKLLADRAAARQE